MKMHHAVAGTLAVVLAVSGALAQRPSRGLAQAIDVTVVDGAVRVSQAEVRTKPGAQTLTWQLLTEGYRFTSSSIDFGRMQGYFSCVTADFGKTVRCTKGADTPSGQFGYRIQLSDGQAMLSLPQSDVFIQNE